MFDIAIVIEPREERVLRKLHKESKRSRRMRHPSVMLLRPGFDPARGARPSDREDRRIEGARINQGLAIQLPPEGAPSKTSGASRYAAARSNALLATSQMRTG